VELPPCPWRLPDPESANRDGLVALGADLQPSTLIAAYRTGLFPMPARRRIGWWSPDPRGVIPVDGLRISRSMARSARRFEMRIDTAFRDVMVACGDPRRPQGWITPAFVDAYTALHEYGWAHSVEAWQDGRLVGGLYGVRINGFFAGESMFHTATDASKVALMVLVDWLNAIDVWLLDVQWTTPHLASLGAIDVARHDYLRLLAQATRG
jgi:leucyl/phenylalanyl-tRNA---protein transferase